MLTLFTFKDVLEEKLKEEQELNVIEVIEPEALPENTEKLEK